MPRPAICAVAAALGPEALTTVPQATTVPSASVTLCTALFIRDMAVTVVPAFVRVGREGVRGSQRWMKKALRRPDARGAGATEEGKECHESRFRPRLSGKNPATERRGWPTNERERIHRLGSRPRGGGGGARARALAATRGDCRGETRGDASPRRRGVVDARQRARGRKSGQHSTAGGRAGTPWVGARVRAVAARRDAGWGGRDRRRTLT